MERRGWLLAVGAVVLIAIGLYVYSAGSDGRGEHAPVPVIRPGGDPGGGGIEAAGGTPTEGSVGSSGRRRLVGDGGVARVALRPEPPEGEGSPGVGPNGVRIQRGIQRGDPDADRSAGWRLGQARRRISILEGREQLYQDAVDRFIAEGRQDTAARQRTTLERVQRRLVEFREQEAELLTEAEDDGTLGEVDQGFEEGEPERSGRIVGGTGATR